MGVESSGGSPLVIFCKGMLDSHVNKAPQTSSRWRNTAVKRSVILMVVSIMALSLAVGCSKKEVTAPVPEQKAAAPVTPAQPAATQGIAGKVVETMNSGGYTYV